MDRITLGVGVVAICITTLCQADQSGAVTNCFEIGDKDKQKECYIERSRHEIEAALEKCDRNEYTLATCSEYRFEQADKTLNELYKEQMTYLRGTPSEQPLIKAQREWIEFRDKDCLYEASGAKGGSLEGFLFAKCKAERTTRRVEDLKRFVHCRENGCPGPNE